MKCDEKQPVCGRCKLGERQCGYAQARAAPRTRKKQNAEFAKRDAAFFLWPGVVNDTRTKEGHRFLIDFRPALFDDMAVHTFNAKNFVRGLVNDHHALHPIVIAVESALQGRE